jgi:hypothetical protein
MKISRIKVRGNGEVPDSGWVDLDPALTVITFKNSAGSNSFSGAIETINPPYDCLTVNPFADFPKTINQNGFTKVISPHKRTISLSIVEASPDLVQQLVEISPLFYETDKIEIGRRLDHSRWLNFVELASSSRWSEVSADIQALLEGSIMPKITAGFKDYIEGLTPSERIKGQLHQSLNRWLSQLIVETPQKAEQLRSILSRVDRADHFRTARKLLDKRIPLFVKIDTVSPGSTRSIPALYYLLDRYVRRITTSPPPSRQENLPFIEQVNREFSRLSFLQPKIHFCSAQESARLIINHEGVTHENVPLLNTVLQLQVVSALAIVLSRLDYQSDPLLIFHHTGQTSSSSDDRLLSRQINKIAGHCQCLLGTDSKNLRRAGFDGIQYDEEEITTMEGGVPMGHTP